MSDDHAATAIGAYGSRLAKLNPTPTIDKLASEGMLMENCFCTNAICSPSRATILTGQYSHITGVTGLGGKVEKDKQTLPIELAKAGYETAVIGKWHLGTQPEAFNYYKVLKSQGKYHNPEFYERKNAQVLEVQVNEQGYSSDIIADSSIKWLKGRDKTKPFFLMIQFKAPHGPWDFAERYKELYADVEIPEPPTMRDRDGFGSIATRGHNNELDFAIGSSIGRRNHHRSYLAKARLKIDDLDDDEALTIAYQDYLKSYLRCVRGVDDNIKRLLDYLESEGELDNTLIVYTSDQGMFLGEHDFGDKRWMYEEALRMPFIIRYPKSINAAARSDAIVNNTDFAPTLLEFAGANTPSQMQGESFREILETGKEPADWRKGSYYRYWLHMNHHHNPAHFGIRTKDYKLIFFYGLSKKGTEDQTPPGWELYDIKNDPLETTNVYAKAEYKKIVKDLKQQLIELRKEVGDSDTGNSAIQNIIDEHWEDTHARANEISHESVKYWESYSKKKGSDKEKKKQKRIK
ncbi:MAG: sulfatase [Phycisphaerae bacterium]|nr:sulfatase [Phycisphaerae bacterium]